MITNVCHPFYGSQCRNELNAT